MGRLLLIVVLFASATAVADDAEDAGAKLHEYFDAFNAKDTSRVSTEIYSTPVHIGGGGGHRVLADPAAAVANLDNLYTEIEAQGWKESVIDNLKVCVLSGSLALVDTRYARMTHDGKPIPPAVRTTLYVLQKLDGDWRIIAFYGHDADKRPACE
jgi:ketosteroid isomerase-like protein